MRHTNIHVKNFYSWGGLAPHEPLRHNHAMNIETLRRMRGLNQEQLAEMSGTSQAQISRAEKGDSGVTLGKLKAIAAALQVPLEDLFLDRTRAEADIVQMYRRLPDAQKTVWLELSKAFLASQRTEP